MSQYHIKNLPASHQGGFTFRNPDAATVAMALGFLDMIGYTQASEVYQRVPRGATSVNVSHVSIANVVRTVHAFSTVVTTLEELFELFKDKPKIAAGHNPEQLTEDQIGTKDGYRPLTIEEHESRAAAKKDADSKLKSPSTMTGFYTNDIESRNGRGEWIAGNGGYLSNHTYRTKLPVGALVWKPTPKIAAGHNPEQLTEDQVGTKDGYRLLTIEEIESRAVIPVDTLTNELDVWRSYGNAPTWRTEMNLNGASKFCTYRTKRPADYWLVENTPIGRATAVLRSRGNEIGLAVHTSSPEEQKLVQEVLKAAGIRHFTGENTDPKFSVISVRNGAGMSYAGAHPTDYDVRRSITISGLANLCALLGVPEPKPTPKIAAGHNPKQLTEDQVGVKDGYRLLTTEEVESRECARLSTLSATHGAELFTDAIEQWLDGSKWDGSAAGFCTRGTYRTKLPVGALVWTKRKLTDSEKIAKIDRELNAVDIGAYRKVRNIRAILSA